MSEHIKKQITDKYENEFYPWIDDNWQRFTGVQELGIDKETFDDNPYGKKRFKGIINFMNSEDWSQRLPETREWINLINKQRNWGNKFPSIHISGVVMIHRFDKEIEKEPGIDWVILSQKVILLVLYPWTSICLVPNGDIKSCCNYESEGQFNVYRGDTLEKAWKEYDNSMQRND